MIPEPEIVTDTVRRVTSYTEEDDPVFINVLPENRQRFYTSGRPVGEIALNDSEF